MSTGNVATYSELEQKKRALLELLNDTQKEITKTFGAEGAIDIHHPERTPGWPVYRHQQYPKMLYHPIKLNQDVEAKRLGIRRRNEANPQLAPLDLPASKPLTVIVANAEGEKQAEAQGFVRTPPVIKADDDVQVFDPLSNPELLQKGKLRK